ncbi:hypothetical protein DND47_30720, partial [Pseudomonas syringae pv. syringae]
GNENDDFLANQVTFDYLTNNGANVESLLQHLEESNPEHQLLADLAEKEAKFDEIVSKYQTAT